MLPRRSMARSWGIFDSRRVFKSLNRFCRSVSRSSFARLAICFIAAPVMLVLDDRSSSTKFGKACTIFSTPASVRALLVSASVSRPFKPVSWSTISSLRTRQLRILSDRRSLSRPKSDTSSTVSSAPSSIEISVRRLSPSSLYLASFPRPSRRVFATLTSAAAGCAAANRPPAESRKAAANSNATSRVIRPVCNEFFMSVSLRGDYYLPRSRIGSSAWKAVCGATRSPPASAGGFDSSNTLRHIHIKAPDGSPGTPGRWALPDQHGTLGCV